jgi:tRNA modification GTPase
VSPHAGTTRDVIEVQLDLDGYPVTVMDTAGIRETEDPVEQEGIKRARARAAEADLVLWLVDAANDQQPLPQGTGPTWIVRNKIDLVAERAGRDQRALFISAISGDGVRELIAALVAFAEAFFGSEEGVLIGRERQRNLLQQTADALRRCIGAVSQGEELAAEELRIAAFALGRLLGRVDVEDILEAIFRDFCIGK